MCSVSINNLPCGSSLLRVPLVNNGGAILALHPQTGSPLIGAGSNASTPAALTTDQRGAGFARIFGSIIDIGAIEVQPIPYPLATASISNITTAGATAYTFTVTYFDAGAANNGINMSTVIGNNSAVRVLGPDGFNVPATYVSVNDSTNGTPRTITGPGASLLTVEPDPDAFGFRLLNSSASLLNISGITFSGGDSTGAGGGLRVTGFNPVISLDDVVFSENSSGAGGGAIAFDDSGFLAIRNSTISGNTSGAGGGGIYFYNGGSLVVENSTVSGNTSASDLSGYYSYSGGGIYFVGDVSTQSVPGLVPGVIIIRNSTLNNNSSGYDGGGIYLESSNGTLLIQNSTISGNSAANSGGGVAVGTGSIVVQNSTISGNSAAAGGGGIARTAGPAGNNTHANSHLFRKSGNFSPHLFPNAQA